MIGRQGRRGAPVGKAATCFWRARGESWWAGGRLDSNRKEDTRQKLQTPARKKGRGRHVAPAWSFEPNGTTKKLASTSFLHATHPSPASDLLHRCRRIIHRQWDPLFTKSPILQPYTHSTMSGPLGNLPGMTYDPLKNRYFPTPKGPLQNDQPAPSLYASTSLPRKGRPEMVLGLLDCQLQRKRQRPDIHESVVSGPGRKLVKGRGRMGVGMGKRSER